MLGEPRAAAAAAARRLGLHYLQRYFFLIAFRWVPCQPSLLCCAGDACCGTWCLLHSCDRRPARLSGHAPARLAWARWGSRGSARPHAGWPPAALALPHPSRCPPPPPAGHTWMPRAGRAPFWLPLSASGCRSGGSSNSCSASWTCPEAAGRRQGRRASRRLRAAGRWLLTTRLTAAGRGRSPSPSRGCAPRRGGSSPCCSTSTAVCMQG